MPRVAPPNLNAVFFDPDGVKRWLWQGLVASTTVNAFGVPSPTLNNSNVNVQDANGDWIKYTTPATANTLAGWTPPSFNLSQIQWNPMLLMTVEFPTSTDFGAHNVRTWCGWCSSSITGTDGTGATGAHIAAFQQSAANGNPTHWYCVTNNSGSTPTFVDSGVAIAAGTKYKLKNDCSNPAQIAFWINNQLVKIINSNLPSASAGMGLVVCSTTTANAAVNLQISTAECRQAA